MIIRFLFGVLGFSLLMCAIAEAQAQTACPHGVAPGSAQCGPSMGGGSIQQPTRQYVESWNWGAFVMDASVSAIGSGFNQPSRQRAIDQATARCQELGGTNCQLVFAFDGCGAVAEPVDKNVLLIPAMAAEPTRQEVGRSAMEACTRFNPGRTCELIWSKCNGTRIELW
jgi:hypothetical protein